MNINTLRQLNRQQLPAVCDEIRQHVIETVEQIGGHLGGSLGVVELTVALHYIFNTPHDKLVWDVGHQAYPHKLLTGRSLSTIRQFGGISGFPKRDESEYDAFGTGHSSTSISAALGMAIADKQLNPHSTTQHIAVIGDGALTAGMAYEAFHHAVTTNANLLIIVNDNGMSISPNIGAMPNMLNQPMHAKQWFAALGLSYFGVIDGHDVNALLDVFEAQKTQSGVRVLHVRTNKGQGYAPANNDTTRAHAIKAKLTKPSIEKTEPSASKVDKTFSELLGDWLCEKAQQDNRLHVITPAMVEGSGLAKFAEHYPDKLTDVAIAEQHAVTLAAGMACAGLKPIVAIYSTFLQRGYDQLIHDVALQNLDVTFVIDRAGIVGEDGATHTGAFDIAFTRCLPNVSVAAPVSSEDFHACLTQCYEQASPTLVRYPKGTAVQSETAHSDDIPLFGKATLVRQGKSIAILAFGTLTEEMLPIANALNATLVNMRYVKPLDAAMLKHITTTHTHMITIEEGATLGGIGEHIANLSNVPTLTLGLPDIVMPHGTRSEVLTLCELSQQHLQTRIEAWLRDSSV